MIHSSAGPLKKNTQAIDKNRKYCCKVTDTSEAFSYLCLYHMALEFSSQFAFGIYFLMILYFLFHCPGISCSLCVVGGSLYSLSQPSPEDMHTQPYHGLMVEKGLPRPLTFSVMLCFGQQAINRCVASKSLKYTCVTEHAHLHSTPSHQKKRIQVATSPVRIRETRGKPLPNLQLGAKPTQVS